MGQQQLLLLILSVIIAALAMVYGISAFGLNLTKANADEMIVEALRIASDVQGWSVRPSMFGGRADNESLADVTFLKIGYPTSTGGTYSSPNGDFTLSTTLATECDPPVVPSGLTPIIYINVTNADTENNICVGIAGPDAEDIGTDAKYGSGITG